MSLELKIEELTAAVKQLTVAMTTAAQATTVLGTVETTKTTRTRATKTEQVAEAAAVVGQVAGVVVDAAVGQVVVQNPEVVRFWHVPQYNTVYRQGPGDAPCTMAGAVQVTEDVYNTLKAELAEKFPTAVATEAAAPAPAPAAQTQVQQQQAVSSAPTATVQVSTASTQEAPWTPTMVDVTAKFQQLVKTPGKGAAAMQKILSEFGVGQLSALAGKNLADVVAKIDAALVG